MTVSGARRRLGRRGVPLVLLGAGQIGWGIGYVAAPTTDTSGLQGLLKLMPLEAWAWLWVGAGAAALVGAVLPEGPDRWGFIAAVMPPTAWALGYMYDGMHGYSRAWFVFAWYLLSHALLILWSASVAEYKLPKRKSHSRRSPSLFLLGVGQVCWGVGFVAAPHTDRRGLDGLLRVMPMDGWAVAWIASGVVTLGALWLPVGPDRWGFAFAVGLPLVWGCGYGWEWITGDYERGAFVLVWYLTAHAGMAAWAAAVPEWELPRYSQEGRA
ncbi:hypothetical protein ACFPC0_11170 [Streptomyces andamanensis]|uniref:Uncharacterized protein n=1 Tax=Streptomyces andamanensis TaxID=1565035 RepID=A0ABV8TCR7_9ACTN